MTIECMEILESDEGSLGWIVKDAGTDFLSQPVRERFRKEHLESHSAREDVRADAPLLGAGEFPRGDCTTTMEHRVHLDHRCAGFGIGHVPHLSPAG